MKTKNFYGINFKVYSDKEINGDFIKEDEVVYFENEVHVKGNLKCKYLKTEKGIKIDGWEEIEKWEEVGWSQEVGGDCTIKYGVTVGLSITIKGIYHVGKRIFAGICPYRDVAENEKQITCSKKESGIIAYGILKETGGNEKSLSGKKVKVEIDDKTYTATID